MASLPSAMGEPSSLARRPSALPAQLISQSGFRGPECFFDGKKQTVSSLDKGVFLDVDVALVDDDELLRSGDMNSVAFARDAEDVFVPCRLVRTR